MNLDPQTLDAIRHLRRVVAQHPDNRRAVKSLRHLEHQLAGTTSREFLQPVTTRATIVTRAAEDNDEEDPVCSDDEPLDDDPDWGWLENVRSTTSELLACPSAIPLPAQEDIVAAAVREAQGAGLQLPQFSIEWREGREGICDGAARWQRDAGVNTFTVVLSVNTWPDALRRTALHELQHIADFHSGVNYSRLELERRAIVFVARCCGER